jgi:hypothetical protein
VMLSGLVGATMRNPPPAAQRALMSSIKAA